MDINDDVFKKFQMPGKYSAYQAFLIKHKNIIRKGGPTSLMQVAQKWRQLSNAEQKKYEVVAKKLTEQRIKKYKEKLISTWEKQRKKDEAFLRKTSRKKPKKSRKSRKSKPSKSRKRKSKSRKRKSKSGKRKRKSRKK